MPSTRRIIRAMYMMGENPAMSDPDAAACASGSRQLEHLVVQDIFLTETAFHADVVLPASAWPEKDGTVTNTNRQVQMGRPALRPARRSPRRIGAIIQDLANGSGPRAGRMTSPKDVYEELRQAMNSIGGISWDRLEQEDAVTYPCDDDGPGTEIMFATGFPTKSGRGKFVATELVAPDELPDDRLSDDPVDRADARTLAYGCNHTPCHRPRRAGARSGGFTPPPRNEAPGYLARRPHSGQQHGAAPSNHRPVRIATCPKAWCSSPSASPRPRPTC